MRLVSNGARRSSPGLSASSGRRSYPPSPLAGFDHHLRRRGIRPALRASAVGMFAVGALALAPSAAAHELGLVLVTGPAGTSLSDGAVDGFRLAVDRSPDVSHPPGQEAGDHLGGIDVDVRVLRPTQVRSDLPRRVARAVATGSRLVVVLPPARPTPSIVSVAPARDVLFLVPRRVTTRARPLVVLTRRPRGGSDPARRAKFERVFTRRYGRAPDAAALTGYDAGRLLDLLLAELGEGPFSAPQLGAAAARARRLLVGSTATVVLAAHASRRVPSIVKPGSGLPRSTVMKKEVRSSTFHGLRSSDAAMDGGDPAAEVGRDLAHAVAVLELSSGDRCYVARVEHDAGERSWRRPNSPPRILWARATRSRCQATGSSSSSSSHLIDAVRDLHARQPRHWSKLASSREARKGPLGIGMHLSPKCSAHRPPWRNVEDLTPL